MKQLPLYIPALFIITAFTAIIIFYLASGKKKIIPIVIFLWMIIQSALAAGGFFTVTNTLPPRFLLVILIPLIVIISLFSTTAGRNFIDGFDKGKLTLLHSIRMPVELVLFWLFIHNAMPRLMTFEGRNFDLFSGITAPIVYYFGFVRRKMFARSLLAWNFICLLILLFTVVNAILSAPTPFQQFGFDQPSIAVLYFPFIWLPGVVVPIVILSHLITMRSLLREVASGELRVAGRRP
jgi:hypothetical protein